MCHFDILTVCHAVTETTPFIYEYIAHTHTHTHLAVYVCVHCVHWNTHVSLGGCSCIVVTWLQKNGAGNLNLCHLLITQTNSLTQTHTQTLTNIRIHTHTQLPSDSFVAQRFVMHGFMFMFLHSFGWHSAIFCRSFPTQLTESCNCWPNGLKKHLSSALAALDGLIVQHI